MYVHYDLSNLFNCDAYWYKIRHSSDSIADRGSVVLFLLGTTHPFSKNIKELTYPSIKYV